MMHMKIVLYRNVKHPKEMTMPDWSLATGATVLNGNFI